MRRVIILSLAALGMFVVSCQKAEITPNGSDNTAIPTWGDEKSNEIYNNDRPTSSGEDDKEAIVQITDPNADPESNPKGDPNSEDE